MATRTNLYFSSGFISIGMKLEHLVLNISSKNVVSFPSRLQEFSFRGIAAFFWSLHSPSKTSLYEKVHCSHWRSFYFIKL